MTIRGNLFLVPYARTATYQKSFFPDTIRIWNALDANTKTSISLDQIHLEVQRTGLPLILITFLVDTVNTAPAQLYVYTHRIVKSVALSMCVIILVGLYIILADHCPPF